MEKISTVSLDLAKTVFQVHGRIPVGMRLFASDCDGTKY